MRTKLLLTLLLFFFSLCSINAQKIKFQKKFQIAGSTEGYCLQEIRDYCQELNHSGYIIVTESYCLIRTDLEGNILWKKQFNFPHGGFSDYVQVTSDCGFLIAGSVFDSNFRRNYVLIKTDPNGTLQWSKQYIPPANDSLFNVITNYMCSNGSYDKVGVKARQTDDNGYVIIGQINSADSNQMHFELIKTDTIGGVQWTKYYDNNLFHNNYFNSYGTESHVYDIDLAGSGSSKGFILLGQVIDSSEFNNYFVLIRTDSMGSVLWSKKYLLSNVGDPLSAGVAIKETKDKGFIVTGNLFGSDPLAFKTDSMGVAKWFRFYGFCNNSNEEGLEGNSVEQTYDGGYIIACNHTYSCEYLEAVLIKIDTIGNVQWTMGYQRHVDNIGGEACNVIQSSDSGYSFCGSIGDAFSLPYIFFVKTDRNGYSGCYDSLLAFCQYNDSVHEFSIGDTMMVSLIDTSISPTIAIPNITVTTYCLATEINNFQENNITLTFYPNPLTCSSTLQLNTRVTNAEVVIYDIVDKQIMRKILTGDRMEIQKGTLEQGVYFVRVMNEERQYVQKLVVE